MHFSPLNPLGCPNLMNGSQRKQNWTKSRLCVYRCFFALLLVISFPFIALFWAPVFVPIIIDDEVYAVRRFRREHCCCYTIIVIISFPILMLLNMFVILPLAAICFLPMVIFAICQYCKERIEMRKDYKRNIKMKFGMGEKKPKRNTRLM